MATEVPTHARPRATAARSVRPASIAVIGTGRMGAMHARSLAALGFGERLVLHDADPRAARRVAASVGATVVPGAADAVAAADAVVIATPAARRSEALRAAVAAAKPVFCEKPLAADLEQAQALAELARREGARILMGFQRRFDPDYTALRGLIAAGRLGRVLHVRAVAYDHLPPDDGYQGSAGDMFTDCLIHDFDAVRWLTGQEVVAVQADLGRVPDDDAEPPREVQLATAVLTLEGGGRAVIAASRLDPRGYDHRLEVLGTRDSLAVGLTAETPLRLVYGARSPAMVAPPQAPGTAPAFRGFLDRFAAAYRAEMRAFLRMVADDLPSPCGPAQALRAQQLAAAAANSARDGRRVQTPVPEREPGSEENPACRT